jgi:hypothetical protein
LDHPEILAANDSVYPIFILSTTDLADLNEWTVKLLKLTLPASLLFVPPSHMKAVVLKLKDTMDEMINHLKQPTPAPHRRHTDDITSLVLGSHDELAGNPWRRRLRQMLRQIQEKLQTNITLIEVH